jgi:hypothetical protein
VSARLALLAAGLAGACLSCAAFAQPQQAQPQPHPHPAQAQAHPTQPRAPASHAADAAIDAQFKAWDTDHDGKLSQAEFGAGMAAFRRRAEAGTEAAVRLRGQFDRIDANRDDAIDAGEYPNLELVRAAGKAAPALSAFDRNRDQRLQFAEYLSLVARLAPAQRIQP